MKINTCLKKMNNQKIKKIVTGVLWVILLLSGWFSFTLCHTRDEWHRAIQSLEENGMRLSAMPTINTNIFPSDSDVSLWEATARETQMQLLSIQEESNALGRYRIELHGSFHNLIYFMNHLSMNHPLCHIEVQCIEPIEKGLYIRMMLTERADTRKIKT